MILPSGSRLGLAMKCMGSFILPIVKSEPGEAAEKGTAFHALVEKFIAEGRKIPETASEMERTLLLRIGELLGTSTPIFERPELACAVYPGAGYSELYTVGRSDRSGANVLGSERRPVENDNRPVLEHVGSVIVSIRERGTDDRILGDQGGLGQGAGGHDRGRARTMEESRTGEPIYNLLLSSEQSGDVDRTGESHGGSGPVRDRSFLAITDLVRCDAEGVYEVYDWKTGHSYVDTPEWNWQLIVPAIALWLIGGKSDEFKCRGAIVKLDLDKGTITPSEPFTYDSAIISAKFNTLKWLAYRASKATSENVTLYEGKHCVFCPARDRCPAKVGALVKAMHLISGVDDSPSDLQVLSTGLALSEASGMLKKVQVGILERNDGRLDLGDGREAVLESKSGKTKVFTRRIRNIVESSPGSVHQNEQGTGSATEENGEPGSSG